MSQLSHQGRSAGWDAANKDNEELQALRQGVHADPQQEAQSLQFRMSRHRWPHERGETLAEIWATEPDIGRIAQGVQNRVDRLRALGNSIVPQIAEIIGHAIMKAER
jgi:DNA (cytosine-5)-methyltransferase 1